MNRFAGKGSETLLTKHALLQVQKHLLKAGGLPADTKPSLGVATPPLVALDPQQVSSLEMLAKVYIPEEADARLYLSERLFDIPGIHRTLTTMTFRTF